MATPTQSPVDAYWLHAGPMVQGSIDHVDAEHVRHALHARSAHPGWLAKGWLSLRGHLGASAASRAAATPDVVRPASTARPVVARGPRPGGPELHLPT